MFDRARARVAEARVDKSVFLVADAMAVDADVPEPVDYVFLANTLHGVPDQLGLARAVAALLNLKANSGSSIGIVGLARKQWSSDSRAARKPRCG